MYLCTCTPDFYFTRTKVLIRLQNKSTKIHSTKEQLLFSSTDACSGGFHGGGGHRHWASLTSSQHSFSKGNAGSRRNLQHKNIDWPRLFHPSLHTCSWGAFLLGFCSSICLLLLLVTHEAAKEKKIWELQHCPLLQLPPGSHSRMQFACKRQSWLRRQAGEGRQLGHLMVTLSSYLISSAQEGLLCLQFPAKTAHHKYPQSPHLKVTEAPLVLLKGTCSRCCSSNPFLVFHRSFWKKIQEQNP